MLQNIRKSTKSGFTYILVGLLIVIFAVFFGVPGDACGGGGQGRVLVANVDGNKLYSDDVNLVYNRVYGGQRSVDESQLLRQQADSLRAVIMVNLLAEEAKEAGLRVSDAEFKDFITDPYRNVEYLSVYGRDGGFDGPLYKAYVQNQIRVNIGKYEEYKRKELLARKFMQLMEMQFRPTPEEVQELHKLRNAEANLDFVKFDPKALKEHAPVTDEELQTFIASNADEIKKHYEENKSDYEMPARVQIRRIFIIKPDPSEGEDKVKEAKKKFAEAKKRVLEDGENFADVAGEISEDFAKEKQGLMDWSTLENLDQNIADAIEGEEIGAVKEVETDFAFMLVKVEDKKDAKKTPLADVREDIARKMLQEQKVDDLIAKLVKQFRDAHESGQTFQETLAALKPGDGDGAESDGGGAGKEAGDEDGDAGDGEETADSASTSPWDAVTVNETGKFTLEGQDLSAMFGGQVPPGMSARTPWDRVPRIGKSAELARTAFTLTEEEPMPKETFQVGGATYLVKLKELDPATDEEFQEAKGKLLAELEAKKASSVLGSWQSLFAVPAPDYGPFLEKLYAEAMNKGRVELVEGKYEAIPYVKRPGAETGTPEIPAVEPAEDKGKEKKPAEKTQAG